MPNFEGVLQAQNLRFAIVVSRFNAPFTERLVGSALDCFKRHGASVEEIPVLWVPGAFEIPLIAKKLAASKKYDAILCLGVLIRGETSHFDLVSAQVASGIMQTALSYDIPTIYNVLSVENIEQAEVRCGIKGANVGFTGALAAIEMANLLKERAPFAS